MPEMVRRVVTGHDAAGKAIVSADGAPPVIVTSPLQAGLAFYEIWNTSEAPVVVDSGEDPTVGRKPDTHPPDRGTVCRIVDIPPEGSKGPDLDAAQAAKLFAAVGLEGAPSTHSKQRHPLMHRTESIDYGIVLSGEINLVLDDCEVRLKTGDVVVQRGTIHAWSNRSDDVCRMAFVLVDGRYDPALKGKLPSQ
jgi:Cupin domain